MATRAFQRVYVWEWPVRLYHWVNAAAVVVLAGTGLLIAYPPAIASTQEASSQFWFGWIRLAHFVAAFVFLFAFVLRVYWLLVGNRYARWDNFLPLTPTLLKRQFQGVLKVLRVDILQTERRTSDILGHNSLAAWSYAVLFALTIFQIVTGLALYAPMSGFWLPQLFAGVATLMGGDATVRLWHHAATWAFIVFSLVHIYLSVFHDVVERQGEISSMVSGVKFVERR
jgi:Ni/Fe-hydrogenase 1 B-type cytochrome subunit